MHGTDFEHFFIFLISSFMPPMAGRGAGAGIGSTGLGDDLKQTSLSELALLGVRKTCFVDSLLICPLILRPVNKLKTQLFLSRNNVYSKMCIE